MHQKLIEINNYREDDSISQSFLKSVSKNDTKTKKSDSESVAMGMGQLVDAMLLTPQLVNEVYHLSEVVAPKPLIKKTIDKVFEEIGEWDNLAFIETYRLFSEAKNPTKEDTIMKGINEAEYYWNALVEGIGRTTITKDYWLNCRKAVDNLLTNPFTKHHFENTLFADIQYQVPIYDEISFKFQEVANGQTYFRDRIIKRKGLLDLLIIDEAHKTVQIKDLKTTSSTPDEWWKYARQFRYDFQMAWYYDIVEKLFPNHRQLMPELVVYSFAAPSKPFTKVLSHDDLMIGRNGVNLQKSFVEYDGGIVEPISERIMGWEECLSRYLICQENGWPDWDVNYWTNNGVVTKNIF